MTNPDDVMAQVDAMNRADIAAGARQAGREAQRQKNEQEGQAQLRAYYAAGLEDCKENADLLTDWIVENAKGIFGKATVIGAVENQRNRLRWKPINQPPTTPPKPPPAHLLPNGDPRLPLGTTPSSRHSITQLRDLDACERATKGRGGWHGAKF
jgi:hypothetical protein